MRTIIKCAAFLSAFAVVGAGCAADTPATNEPTTGPSSPPAPEPSLTVAAAFYPLEYVASVIGGDDVVVQAVTEPGVEPHDFELSPAGVRELGGSDLIIYLEEFQPSVDAAVAELDVPSLNVADHIELREFTDLAHEDEDGHEDEDEDGHEEDDDHGHGDTDPHFWLDPELYAQFGHVLAETFSELDPANAPDYADRAASFEAQMTDLDASFASSLSQCERSVIVVPHEAYGYLTDRYGLTQIGLAGVSPDAEPSPARVREIRDLAVEYGVTTIFFETLVDSAVSEVFAADLGLDTAVLDPLEGLVNPDDDYRSVMDRNRDALADALGCQ